MTDEPAVPRVTILPDQGRRLGALSQVYRCAIGVSQTGSVLHIDTGGLKFDIGPDGKNIHDHKGLL